MRTSPLIDHFANPRNVGVIENPDGYGREGSVDDGDMMELYIRVVDGVVADVKYRTFGCATAIASSSMASEMLKGKTLEAAAAIDEAQIAEALGGLPPSKMHCSVMAAAAFRRALEDYRAKQASQAPEAPR